MKFLSLISLCVLSFAVLIYFFLTQGGYESRNDLAFYGTLKPVQAFTPSNMTAELLGSPRPTITSDFSSNMTGQCSNEGSPSRACIVAEQLKKLNGSQIADFGLADYGNEVIKRALNLLDAGNLTKVLRNLPKEDLMAIENGLSPEVLNSIINKTAATDRLNISARLNG